MAATFSLLPLAGSGFLIATITSFVATRVVLAHLRRRNLLDIPNERSSHTVATPRGGGWGVVIGSAAAWLAIVSLGGGALWMAGLGLALLIAVVLSWRDDLGGLPVGVRLVAQYAAAGAALTGWPRFSMVEKSQTAGSSTSLITKRCMPPV